MVISAAPERVQALRALNRSCTQRAGALDEHLLASRFSLTESRLPWELAYRDGTTLTELACQFALDAGDLSRLLRRLRDQGLVKALPHADDARQRTLSLSAAGRRAVQPLDRASQARASALLGWRPETQQAGLGVGETWEGALD